MPTTIEATYRVVTPLFCAGAVPESAELRVPSFKGMLRFWWRALAWLQHNGDLATIRNKEDALFGSTNTGQSLILMRLVLESGTPKPVCVGEILKTPGTDQVVGEGARYLGYGVMEAFPSYRKGTKAGQLTRGCLLSPFEFTVKMRGRNLNVPELGLLKDALIALGTLGGMGAKSRKGYGSLVLRSLRIDGKEQWRKPQSVKELSDAIAFLGSSDKATSLPEFTALSGQARHVLVSSRKRAPVQLLDLVGRELVRFRSWGHKGKILGNIPSEQQFSDDHDLMKMPWRQQDSHPRRIAFGLPHNYGRGNRKQVGPFEESLDRRASPLFIHIHECGGNPVAVLSFLPARFLPKGRSDISVGGKKIPQTLEHALYRTIHDFLDRLLDADKRKEPFTRVVEARR